MPLFSTRVIAAVAISLAAGAFVSPTAATASTSMLVRGTVSCSGGQPAVGVWIESSAGGSEWADDKSWQYSKSSPNWSYRYFEEKVSSPATTTKISLHVGCGGKPSKWGKDLWAYDYPVTAKGRVINVACDYGKRSRVKGACKQAPVGRDAGSNPYKGYEGYCTGGAVYRWYKATGYWPYLHRKRDGTGSGDAKWMDDNATSNGFRVRKVPHVRSIVVFNNRSTWGHVGWVTKVYRVGSTIYFDYIDRNGSGPVDATGKGPDFGVDKTRKNQPWDSSQRFIVARVYPK